MSSSMQDLYSVRFCKILFTKLQSYLSAVYTCAYCYKTCAAPFKSPYLTLGAIVMRVPDVWDPAVMLPARPFIRISHAQQKLNSNKNRN